MAGLHGPLPTLRPWPGGQTRTARGRRGSLLLRRIGLSPTTPRRSPGALPNPTANDPLGQSPHARNGTNRPTDRPAKGRWYYPVRETGVTRVTTRRIPGFAGDR